MRKTGSVVCILLAAAVVLAAARLAPSLPGNARTYIERKYAGWNGVLHAWVYEGDGCGGSSLLGWLGKCAAAFEKANAGVYIEFEQVPAEKILFLNSAKLKPDLIFFPPGLLSTADGLAEINDDLLRPELRGLGGGHALPVAMGGYIWAVNPDADLQAVALPADTVSGKYSAAAICLLQDSGETEAPIPEYELDIGLAASAMESGILIDENAFARFRNGEFRQVLVSQRELAKLISLRSEGKGVNWQLEGGGDYVYTDQFLYAAILKNNTADAGARAALCSNFLHSMLADEMQKQLAGRGAFPVTEVWAHAGGSALAKLEAQLRRGRLIAPGCFSEYWNADPGSIVRDFTRGSFSQAEALRRLMLAGMRMGM